MNHSSNKGTHRPDLKWISLSRSRSPEIQKLLLEIKTHPYYAAINVGVLTELLYYRPPGQTHKQIRALQTEALYKMQDILDKISIEITGEIL